MSILPYLSYRSYLTRRFGQPVLRIPVNAGFSCPNRDGTVGSDGCVFCDNRSFSPVALDSSAVVDQLAQQTARARGYNAFIAYLQPFSNTYGNLERLKQTYEPIISYPRMVGLAVGTRPDCFTSETFDYVADVSRRTYLCIELGLQSSNDITLSALNRGHSASTFVKTVQELHQRGIEVAAHVILGLPGETPEMMIDTARFLASLPVSGVKIHQLMIIKETILEKWYSAGKAPVFTIEEYSRVLGGFLQNLRPDQHIHRIMAESTAGQGLIAPLWSAEKTRSLESIHAYLKSTKLQQGDSCRTSLPA
jgi:hypothetical protein